MTSGDFFIKILSFIGECLDDLVEMFFSFAPVTVILSILLGIIVFSIVFGILRGRKM